MTIERRCEHYHFVLIPIAAAVPPTVLILLTSTSLSEGMALAAFVCLATLVVWFLVAAFQLRYSQYFAGNLFYDHARVGTEAAMVATGLVPLLTWTFWALGLKYLPAPWPLALGILMGQIPSIWLHWRLVPHVEKKPLSYLPLFIDLVGASTTILALAGVLLLAWSVFSAAVVGQTNPETALENAESANERLPSPSASPAPSTISSPHETTVPDVFPKQDALRLSQDAVQRLFHCAKEGFPWPIHFDDGTYADVSVRDYEILARGARTRHRLLDTSICASLYSVVPAMMKAERESASRSDLVRHLEYVKRIYATFKVTGGRIDLPEPQFLGSFVYPLHQAHSPTLGLSIPVLPNPGVSKRHDRAVIGWIVLEGTPSLDMNVEDANAAIIRRLALGFLPLVHRADIRVWMKPSAACFLQQDQDGTFLAIASVADVEMKAELK